MTSPARILVVDDDPAVLRATVRILSGAGHAVTEAATGEAAWQAIAEQKPDVILLDVVLPDVDGLTLCRRVKAEPALADSFAILLSGSRIKSESQADGLSAGADGYIARPISNQELVARVQAILRIRTVQLELRMMARRQAVIAQLGLRVLQTNDVGAISRETTEQAATTLAVPCAAVLEFGQGQRDGRVRTGVGWAEDVAGTSWLGQDAAALAVAERLGAGPVTVGGAPQQPETWIAMPPLLAARGVSNGIAAPVHGRTRALAALAVFSTAPREFTVDEVHFLQTLANILSTVLVRQEGEAEHRRLEKRIQQGEKLQSLSILAGGIAHDFNNLLQAILGNAEMAAHELANPETVQADLAEIKSAAERAAELTAQMLAYTGNTLFRAETMDLRAVVSRAVATYGSKLGHGLPVTCELPPVPLLIRGEAVQLEKAIGNLLVNAAEAVEGADGAIRLRAGVMEATPDYLEAAVLGDLLSPGSCVFLEISDTGGGMDAETLARIFDPFFSTKFTGRGLGLPTVLGIMRGHNGAVRVASVRGKGSSFTLLFPRAVAARIVPLRTELADTSSTPWRGVGTVLVVDDEPSVRRIVRKILETTGLTVLTAADGPDGIRVFQERGQEVDLVIQDLTMPGMNGVEVMRKLRSIRADVRVVICSGYSAEHVTAMCAETPPFGFLPKPSAPAAIIAAVRAALAAPVIGDRYGTGEVASRGNA